MTEEKLIITFSEEKFEMKNALISGRNNDFFGSPISIYCGALDLEEIHHSLFYIHRAVLKLLLDEFDFPLDECDDFLLSAVSEALTKEWNVRNGMKENVAVNKVVKFRKNQK